MYLTRKKLLIICLIFTTSFSKKVLKKRNKNHRDPRLFSLFSIVQFPNDPCISSLDGSFTGTCLTSEGCSEGGGVQEGNCASGFGVCCIFRLTATGTSVNQNCTYVQNVGFPSAFTSTGTTVSHSIGRFDSDICQVRLDFRTFVVASPDNTGLCTPADMLTITQNTGGLIPVTCGTLTGQHMYLETAGTGDMGTLAIAIGAAVATRMWNIKVTGIPCNSPAKAPSDCLQYFTNVYGTVTSFNFPGQQFLQNQQYRVCVRENVGFCQIQWTESNMATPDPFRLGGGVAIKAETVICTISNVNFQLPGMALNAFCGGLFCNVDDSLVACAITSGENPFRLNVFADDVTQATFTGFSLVYNQVPCGNNPP